MVMYVSSFAVVFVAATISVVLPSLLVWRQGMYIASLQTAPTTCILSR
mgnify:CR=1 FL=1